MRVGQMITFNFGSDFQMEVVGFVGISVLSFQRVEVEVVVIKSALFVLELVFIIVQRIVETSSARCVVLLADKLGVVDDVELLPGEELFTAHKAGEALQVEHLVAGLPDQVLRTYTLPTPTALCSKSPVKILPAEDLAISTEAFLVEHKPTV